MAIQDEIPKSRLTMRYKTEIEGQAEDISLPMRLAVLGDFSKGTSKDSKVDLDERRVRNLDGTNTDAVMKDMGVKLSMAVENKIDGEGDDMQVDLPIDSMKAFSPDEIAQHVPKLRGLLTLKTLVEEAVSNVDNRKEFRKLLAQLMANPEALEKMIGELKGFESFKVPTAKPAEGADA